MRLGKVRSAGEVPDIKLNLADAPSELIVEPGRSMRWYVLARMHCEPVPAM